ncbi:PAS domain-containing protein [Methylophaga sp.]|uniref:sensor domain-containing diguanylate cyclase n=1 Tax=Methylophaga sp. TaxID=2024840 RepID=UPI00271E9F3A|nr:PAS domain-containing protein [Methylophaga sp.]MDO8827733.1 diguanylate cyclase [Methylophaga sp.]
MSNLPADNQGKFFEAAVEQAFNAVLITQSQNDHGDHPIIYANWAFCKLTGYSLEELIGKDPRILQGPGTSKVVIDDLRACLKTGRNFQGSTINYRKDGEPYYVEWTISPILGSSGKVECYLSIQQDISNQKLADKYNELLTSAFNVTDDAVFITDNKAKIEFVNEAFLRLTGYSKDEMIGQRPSILKSGEHAKDFYKKLWHTILSGKTFRATFINKNKNGELYHQEQTITPILDDNGDVNNYVSISKDMTKWVEEEMAFREETRKDSLTGALTRGQGERELEHLFVSNGDNGPISLAIIDIDYFKRVNDTWGHDTGDEIIQLVATAMINSVRSTDFVVRWGGEEFVIVMNQCSLASASIMIERCCNTISKISHPKVGKITVSVGLAQKVTKEMPHELIKRADIALYQAKAEGRNRIVKSG